ncbi:hypothetical protein [Aeromonas rivipollensis]|uniref:hypothetical protein n=1 Tax=Aeromonas rivipollensis TaxID=948519 RepID=UPI00372D072B
MDQVASLTEALIANTQLLQALLQQKQYDEAQSCMDERLALIASLTQLAKNNPAQRQDIIALAEMQLTQEQEMVESTYSQHQEVFKKLTQLSKANKAGQAYRINIQES